jgi:SAM-dependent methyltransferase
VTVFEEIYRDNRWNGVESRSGPGSGLAPTTYIAAAIVELVARLEVRSVLDAACGDGFWMPELPGYVGVDVAGEAIELARRNHPDRTYRVGSAATLPPAPFDLVIRRDAIQHLSFADGLAAIAGIRRTGSTWLLASTYVDGENVDIATGDCYSPDLAVEPFDLGPPLELIVDGYGYEHLGEIRDPRKHLGLWPLLWS